MVKKQKNKIAQMKESKNCGSESDILYVVTIIDVNEYSTLGAPRFLLMKNEEDSNKELSGMIFCSCDPFPSSYSNDDSEDDNE